MKIALTLLICITLLLLVLNFFKQKNEAKRGWKINRENAKFFKYSEYQNNKWKSILIEGELYAKGQPRNAIYIRSDWSKYPDWAINNKTTIVARIKEKFQPPAFTVFIEGEKMDNSSCYCNAVSQFNTTPHIKYLKKIGTINDGYYNPELLKCSNCQFLWTSFISDDSRGQMRYEKFDPKDKPFIQYD